MIVVLSLIIVHLLLSIICYGMFKTHLKISRSECLLSATPVLNFAMVLFIFVIWLDCGCKDKLIKFADES